MGGHGHEQEDVQHQLEREPAEASPFLQGVEDVEGCVV
jgi:hypothetical protein